MRTQTLGILLTTERHRGAQGLPVIIKNKVQNITDCLLRLYLVSTLFLITGCTVNEVDIQKYHELVNRAELAICSDRLSISSQLYQEAFSHIDKPFGKDLFNAALVEGQLHNKMTLLQYLQQLVNNLDEFDYLKSAFVNSKISNQEWQNLLDNREVSFDPVLKKEVEEILNRDQMYRPDYDTHDSLIYDNLIINLQWIVEKIKFSEFPAHQELGYRYSFRGQDHHLVLHHTAQRRSYDKTMLDLEPILYEAVQSGRLDPERAIQYLIYQNDNLDFQNYTVWQFQHSLLPDSLTSVYWSTDLTEKSSLVDSTRLTWMACSMTDAEKKAKYLSENLSSDYIFTSVNRAEGNLDERLEFEEAMATFKLLTQGKIAFTATNPTTFID